MTYHSNSYCDIKLKPPKIPLKSNRIYFGIFVRKQGYFNHLYWTDGLYIVSILTEISPTDWIDRNYDKLRERRWEIKEGKT